MSDEALGLVAVTRAVDGEVDPFAVAGDDGFLWAREGSWLAARGEAARIAVPRTDPAAAAEAVRTALSSIEVEGGAPGAPRRGPIALGALPFDRARPGRLVIPELLVGQELDGRRWMTAITGTGAVPELSSAVELGASGEPGSLEPSPEDGTGEPVITSERPAEEWCESVMAARQALRTGAAGKVVLARAVRLRAGGPISRTAVLRRLAAAYPGCMLYSMDGLVGASPELLVSRAGDVVRSHPMAGTAPRSDDPELDADLTDELLASAKDQAEHRITIDMVHDTLLPWCSYLDEEAEASVVAMANVAHLATYVEGRLSAPAASVVELMTALHPTPAVCGWPREAALDLIEEHEGLDRGRYAGPVGWVDADGDGEWAVGIRCAEIEGSNARLFAGVGVMPDSDPIAELAETEAKLKALLEALTP